ncbi:MAG: hypothetical protein ABIC40_02220, partial [bacterium]
MNRINALTILLIISVSFFIGCSGRSNPVLPLDQSDLTGRIHGTSATANPVQTHLWGYFDLYFDAENLIIDAVPNRQVMFTANVVKFINSNPAFLSFKINKTVPTVDYVDVDIDVSIRHPFPGLDGYRGYDVRGVFMGDGSASLEHNGEMNYPVFGEDQFMFDEPGGTDADDGGPDGYTRWYNISEFGSPTMPLFGY